MKKSIGMALIISLLASLMAFAPLAYAEPGALIATSGLDLVEYGQNAMRVYFDRNITNSAADVTMANIQALAPGDANYDESVVNGVLDGIFLDGKSVRDWNVGGPYGVMVHYYKDDSGSFIAVYADASLVNFADGNEHLVTVTSLFTSYDGDGAKGAAFIRDPVTAAWNTAKINVTQGLDLTEYSQNAMRVYFDKNISNSDVDVTIASIQALVPGDANYDPDVVNGILDGILVDGTSVRDWNTDSAYGVMVHFYKEGTESFIAVYADAALINFADGNAHTVEVTSAFKDYLMRSAQPATLYLDPAEMTWSTTAPLPVMAVTGGDSHPDFAWGNTMRVLFDNPVWVPVVAQELLLNAQDLVEGDDYYDADAVASINDKIVIDGKTVREWNDQQAGAAQVHVGSAENDLRIYMEGSLVGFGDGNTHVVTILENFISFSGKTTAEAVSLHYDPVAKTWGTEVVVPPTPTPGAATAVFTVSPLLMSNQFGTAYFYTSTVVTSVATINIQAGGGNIPEEVQNSVLDFIMVDGKTVREWNTENETNYAVMVAYESESSGSSMLGRIGFFIDTGSTCNFVPEEDHTIEFLDGLIGLNHAPILPSKWNWSAQDAEWYEVMEEEPTITPDDDEEAPQTSDPVPYVFVFGAIIVAGVILVTRKTSKA